MDKRYWQNYYKSTSAPSEPSSFAEYVSGKYLDAGSEIVELGCGNGRDATYFAYRGMSVLAIDQAVNNDVSSLNNPTFMNADFTTLEGMYDRFDGVYSRFTLHSISADEQERVLRWSRRALKIGGYLCIEVRGYKNSLYELGEKVLDEEDAYIYDNHYRRFIDKAHLDHKLGKIGFEVLESTEDKGFAPFNGEDDYFIRSISQKV